MFTLIYFYFNKKFLSCKEENFGEIVADLRRILRFQFQSDKAKGSLSDAGKEDDDVELYGRVWYTVRVFGDRHQNVCNLSNMKELLTDSGYLCMNQNDDRIFFNKGYTESRQQIKVRIIF